MESINKFRSTVFNRAHEIMRTTGKSFGVCLSKAWALYRLSRKLISSDEVIFTYEKKDKSLRRAYGTLKGVGRFIKGTGKVNHKVFRYWDLEAAAFRCFKVENFVTTF